MEEFNMGMNVRDVLSLSPVLPVMVVHDLDSIANAAQALFDGGIRAFEITLRTPQALSAITLLRQTLPPAAIIGAGTITQVQHLQAAIQAGAQFGVSTSGESRSLDIFTWGGHRK